MGQQAHIASMAYNMFLHSSSGEAPFYLVFWWDALMPTLFKLLLPKIRYMDDKKCRINLDVMREIYMMTRYGSTEKPYPTTAFDSKYKPNYRICKWLSDKAFDVQDNTGKVRHTSIQYS